MSLQKQYQELRTQVLSEWRSSKRLQLIVVASAVLFIAFGHVQLERWRAAAEEQAKRTMMELNDTRLAAREKAWPKRAEEAGKVLEQVRQQLWSANTEGEAQAALRDWLQAQASASGVKINQMTVDVGATLPNGSTLSPVRADIRGEYEAGAWQNMLSNIEKNVPSIIVEFEQIDVSRRSRYRLGLLAWFDLTAGATASEEREQ
ncbi:MAG: hypothetical protein WCY88_13795 [Spongiibacteraceae bacterium]